MLKTVYIETFSNIQMLKHEYINPDNDLGKICINL